MKEQLRMLANEYENPTFLENDPSQFMHRYKETADVEVVAIISANLAFGRRDQILKHVQEIIDYINSSGKSPAAWIRDGNWETHFPDCRKSFYRMYTYADMRIFFSTIRNILAKRESLGSYFEEKWQLNQSLPENQRKKYLHQIIAAAFPENCNLISHSKDSAAKKLNMFLRWMVRTDSPVDLGLWNWYQKDRLLMPMDTHVLQKGCELGLIEYTSSGKVPGATLSTCVKLTDKLKEFFPGDPVRGDFALFGSGVNK